MSRRKKAYCAGHPKEGPCNAESITVANTYMRTVTLHRYFTWFHNVAEIVARRYNRVIDVLVLAFPQHLRDNKEDEDLERLLSYF